MTQDSEATRRNFLKGSAILSAPLAVAVPGAVMAADERHARLQRLEDEAAIRALHRDWLRRVNGRAETAELFASAKAAQCLEGAVCAIAPDPDDAGSIEIAPDGRSARGTFACLIETETRLAPENIFAQMALAQGGGITRTGERRLVEAGYAKMGERWMIAGIWARTI